MSDKRYSFKVIDAKENEKLYHEIRDKLSKSHLSSWEVLGLLDELKDDLLTFLRGDDE